MTCRHCNHQLKELFLDLGYSAPSNAYLSPDHLGKPEITYPLRVQVCSNCWLVQTEDYTEAESLFDNEYAYFSSTSKSWLDHCRRYSQMITEKLKLDENSHVVELASNDGYLLKNFVEKGIPCLGIEPTKSTADAAVEQGVPTLNKFFSALLANELVKQSKSADLIIGNNVFAHVPDINDFTEGISLLLKSDGVVTLEFPHLLELIKFVQFDTVYHEHFSYLSLLAVNSIFYKYDLEVFDVEQIPTHGGSLRIYGSRLGSKEVTKQVSTLIEAEKKFGLDNIETYRGFQEKAIKIKNDFLLFLLEAKKQGKSVAGYGAAAKGNTLMNYAGIKSDMMKYVCDAAPSKQGKFLPGSHIPVLNPEILKSDKPDYIVILPWNIKEEVLSALEYTREWGAKFVVIQPELTILN